MLAWQELALCLVLTGPTPECPPKVWQEGSVDSRRVTAFEAQQLPSQLSKQRLRTLLQTASNSMYMKGFRYLGDVFDFDHGHLLFSNRHHNRQPLAILYHTQEYAHHFHQAAPGGRYDYLDPLSRNWIQWLDNGRVENARKYVKMSERGWDTYDRYYTIHDSMLDSGKTGFVLQSSFQWLFSAYPCDQLTTEQLNPDSDSNAITITVSNSEPICLLLLNTECYYHPEWCTQ